MFFLHGPASALEAAVGFSKVPPPGTITIGVSGLEEKSLREHIQKGFRASVQYRLRVYRINEKLLGALGDDMLFEAHPSQTGRWDPFSASYEIRFFDGERRYYIDWDAFYRGFTGLRNFPIPAFSDDKVYILVQARFQKMVFSPPLNVLSVFLSRYTYLSPWRRLDLE